MISKDKARVTMPVYWVNSFVAGSYLYSQDKYGAQVCHYLCGVIHGVMELFVSLLVEETEEKYGTPLPFKISLDHVDETSCKAQGKEYCTMEYTIDIARREV